MTQHEKIIAMCSDDGWHCQNAFRELFIFSPHKRRGEIEKKGTYMFDERKCIHGVRGQKDYKMKRTLPEAFKTLTFPPANIKIKQPQLI